MEDVEWTHVPQVERPILAIALRGLFDAAEAATGAVAHLSTLYNAETAATIDPESFFDFSQERPSVALVDGRRKITWPENTVLAAGNPDGRDLILMSGVEPHLRWRTFSSCVVEVARKTGAELVVTLGAMVGMAPHTRPLGVIGSTTREELAARLGLGRPSYEGPTGLVGALHDALDAADLPVISLRVSVPHYVPSPPNPEATRSLLSRFELVTGIRTDHQSFDSAASTWQERVNAAVADDDEMEAYVRQLERQVDRSADELLPSGDDLAAELQAYLRDQREDGSGNQ